MALLTLTRAPTVRQLELFQQWLQPQDALLLREDARLMIWHPNPTAAQGFVRATDAKALGGRRHPDWTLISDQQWVSLSTEHQPIINW